MLNKNNFWRKNLLLGVVLIFVHLLVVSSASGQMKLKKVKGGFDMPFDTSFFGDEPNAESKAKALQQAKVEAWKKYLSINLSSTRMAMYMKVKKQVLENLDDYVMDLRTTGFKVNKEENTLRVAYKARINEVGFEAFMQSTSPVSATASGEGSIFAFVFVARQVAEENAFSQSSKTFDPRRTTVQKDELMNSAEENAQTDGGSSATSSSQTAASKTTTGGSTLQKSGTTTNRMTERKMVLKTSKELKTMVGETLIGGGYEVVEYEDVVSECGGVEMSQIEKEYTDVKAKLSRPTRKAAFKGARECEVNYFAIGTMDQSVGKVDASGAIRVMTQVTAKVYSLAKRLPRTVATINRDYAGFGPSDEEAYRNGLRQAAKTATQEIVAQLHSKGLK